MAHSVIVAGLDVHAAQTHAAQLPARFRDLIRAREDVRGDLVRGTGC